MRHVSRTHRVALDWLFDRFNLDPKIQIKYVDSKAKWQTCWPKVVSRVTNGTIFCIFSSSWIFRLSRSHFCLSNRTCNVVMSKRSQEGLSDDSTVKATSRAMNPVSHQNLSSGRQTSQSLSVGTQNSQNTRDPKFPKSDGTDQLSSSFGKTLRGNADESLTALWKEATRESQVKLVPSILNGILASGKLSEKHVIKIVQNFQDGNNSVPLLATRNRCGATRKDRIQNLQDVNTSVPSQVTGNLYEGHRHQKPTLNSVTWKLQTQSAWRRSLRTCIIRWQEDRPHQILRCQLRRPIWGDGLWYHRWKQPYIWIRNTQRIWKYQRIQNLTILKPVQHHQEIDIK